MTAQGNWALQEALWCQQRPFKPANGRPLAPRPKQHTQYTDTSGLAPLNEGGVNYKCEMGRTVHLLHYITIMHSCPRTQFLVNRSGVSGQRNKDLVEIGPAQLSGLIVSQTIQRNVCPAYHRSGRVMEPIKAIMVCGDGAIKLRSISVCSH